MAITPGQVGAAVAGQVPAFFNDAFDQFRQGEGGYIRDGQPEGIVAQIGQAVARSACRRYGDEGPEAVGSKGERFERACRPYLDSLVPGEGAKFRIPYEGGQCPISYRLRSELTVNGGTPQPSGLRVLIGPLGALVTQREGNIQRFGVFAQGSRASTFDQCGAITSNVPGFFAIQTVNTSQPDVVFRLTELVPCDAVPDDCGNPPPQVEQPRPIDDPIPPPFRFNPGPGVDVDIDVNLDVDGTINVDFGDGPINIDPFPDDDGGGGGGGGGGGQKPQEPGSPGPASDTGGGGGAGGGDNEAEGEAPEGSVLTGLRVEILSAPASRRRYTDEVDRGVAYVYMGTPTEGLGLEPTGAMVRNGQFFFAQKDYLTRWVVRANFGYNLRVTPYYREVEE